DRADVRVAENDVAANDIAVAAGVAHRGEADGRLARPRFADKTDHFATAKLERDVVDQDGAVAGVGANGNAHVANVEDDGVLVARRNLGLRTHAPSPWPLEWIDRIQSTTKFTPIERI